MMMQRSLIMVMSIALLGLGVAGAEETMKSGQEKFDKQMSPEGNAMGVPVPGSAKDIESTEKQPDTSKIQSSKTLERLPNSVEGEILKIDGENYEIRGSSGDRVRLIVNTDTNFDCAAAPTGGGKADSMTSERLSSKDQAPHASDQQVAQGQRKDETARGSGFQIGKCDFKQGDVVKAEIDDNNRATTLKYISGSGSKSGSGEMGMGQPKTGKPSGKQMR